MRIVHYFNILRLELGGPVRATLDLCRLLAARGHSVSLMTYDAPDAPAEWDGRDPRLPTIIRVPAPARRGAGYSGAQVKAMAAHVQGADALHLHGVWNIENNQLGKLARSLGVPYFVSVRGMLDDWCMAQRGLKKRVFLALGGRRCLEQATRVHLTAQAEHDQAVRWFPRGRGVVIPNFLDLAPFRALPGPAMARAAFPILRRGGPVVLFLSRVHEKKGIEHLLRAAAIWKRSAGGAGAAGAGGGPVSVAIAGHGEAGYVESLKGLAAELGVGEDVAFLGQVNGALKLSLYQAADLFVLPTSQENFGFVFPESLACGTPVITTKGVDIWPELLESGGAAIVAQEAEAIAAAAAPLLADPARRRAMGEAGRTWVMRWLEEDGILSRFEAMYAGK